MVIHNLNFLLSKHNMVSPAISSLRSPWKTEAFQGDPYRPCLVLRPEGARRVVQIGESECAHESVLGTHLSGGASAYCPPIWQMHGLLGCWRQSLSCRGARVSIVCIV